MAAVTTSTTTQKWSDLVWMDEGIEVGLRFISKLAEVVLLIGVGYAGYKIAHKGGTPPTLDEIWLVSQVLALDLSAPGMFASAKAATRAGELERAKWAKAIGISLIAMSILSMCDGAIQYYLVGLIPANIVTWSSLIMTIIRCAAAVGYSVYCRYSKVDTEEVVSPQPVQPAQNLNIQPIQDSRIDAITEEVSRLSALVLQMSQTVNVYVNSQENGKSVQTHIQEIQEPVQQIEATAASIHTDEEETPMNDSQSAPDEPATTYPEVPGIADDVVKLIVDERLKGVAWSQVAINLGKNYTRVVKPVKEVYIATCTDIQAA